MVNKRVEALKQRIELCRLLIQIVVAILVADMAGSIGYLKSYGFNFWSLAGFMLSSILLFAVIFLIIIHLKLINDIESWN